jgi:DNA-binding LacI/PurR family transcriptional regulator
MREVATRAGVSLQTVSNVVNGRTHLMSAQTKQRVAEALDELGYWPNAAARSLRARRSTTLGFLVLDEGSRFLADPMTDLIVAGVGDVARDAGYSVLIQAASPRSSSTDRLLAPLLEHRVDGAILFLSGAPTLRRRVVRRIVELGFPFAVFERLPASWQVRSITADNRAGARALVAHLVARGHRRIAFLSTRVPWPMVEERLAGYRDGLRAAGIETDPGLELGDGVWSPADGARMTASVLGSDDPPSAVMCGNDLLALGAMRAAQRLGLRVPGEVAVTGFNDFEFAEFVDPPLTTVHVPGYELGRAAASSVLAQLDLSGEEQVPPGSVTLPVELKIRATT